MTKKVNTGLTGADTSMAAALLSAGVKPVSAPAVPAAAPAPATPTLAATAPNPPASPQAAIDATTTLAAEIDAAKKVWEHAKATGISKDQFLTFCQIDPEKFAFYTTHKKAIFGSKKQQLEEAAGTVVNAASKPSTKSGKVKKNKKLTARANKVGRAIFA